MARIIKVESGDGDPGGGGGDGPDFKDMIILDDLEEGAEVMFSIEGEYVIARLWVAMTSSFGEPFLTLTAGASTQKTPTKKFTVPTSGEVHLKMKIQAHEGGARRALVTAELP